MKQFVVLFALTVAAVSANIIAKPGFPEGRIINGQEAEPGAAPFIVSLQTTSGSHFCGGSIVDKSRILTAAHCAVYNDFYVVAGAHDYTDKTTTQRVRAFLSKTKVHESYGGGVGPHDIALIHLDEPLDLTAVARDGSSPVAAIDLPTLQLQAIDNGTLFGWGRDNSGALPKNLQTLDVKVLDFDTCKAELPSSSSLDECNICTHNAGTADGACNGDSGGPLVSSKTDGSRQLIGIVSWGYTPCVTTSLPSVYTAVSKYLVWISENWNPEETI
ncbi:lectizyme [Drosophila tropicalis]|uniref:lectizyme n=1 Tax=Drosophila tropicalis TaxID=46794 RepID=UPI0035ABF281